MNTVEFTARSAPRSRWVVDGLIAAVVAALVTVGVWAEVTAAPAPVGFPAGAYLIGLASGAILVIRRGRPLLCALGVFALVALYHFVGYPGAAPALALFPALFTLAEHAKSVRLVVVAIVFVPAWLLVEALPPDATPVWSYALTGPAVGMLAAIALGASIRQLRRSHERDVAAARVEADAAATERLAQERLRIAREVHDVLAHTISAVAVQSAAALDAFDAGEPEGARWPVERIRALTKEASPEVRRAVEALRGEDAPARAPQPGLGDLDALVAGAKQNGLEARVERAGDLAAVSAVTGLTAYRIVQEALTNVVKHARAHRVDVAVHVEGRMLVLDVADDGTAGAQGDGPGGFGIRGMTERAAAIGGTVTTGPRAPRGFAVHADLPLGGDLAERAP